MPKVPSNVVRGNFPAEQMPSQTEMFMAAAVMDDHGKLFVPDEGMPFLQEIPIGSLGTPAEVLHTMDKKGMSRDKSVPQIRKILKEDGHDPEKAPVS